MAILPSSGRAALAISVAARPLHLAWGSGDPSWDGAVPAEPVAATALVAEVGRRGGPQLAFVERDDADGEIELPDERWRAVGVPGPDGEPVSGVASGVLYARWQFDYADGTVPENATVRELGVFVGTQVKASVLAAQPGRSYFAPADLENPGRLLVLQRIPKFVRSPQNRPPFEFILPF